MNYASTTNIEEVIKLYNLGDKTYETDFSAVLFRSESKGSCFHTNERSKDTTFETIELFFETFCDETVTVYDNFFFGGGRGKGGDTFKTPPPSNNLSTPYFKMFFERLLNEPPPPHLKHLSKSGGG